MPILILILIIIALVTIFSVQNATPVAISFFVWKFEASLAIVVYLFVILGIFLGMIIAYWRMVKSSLKKSSPKKNRGNPEVEQ
ncbi:MAG: lipopolysaccharide assembly protein LapA domain-containing protein [Dissulfurimicrobium hydrothermale]|uniref:lipopolysaccharide assembly protein LapA domain-containing protein n=1 Tax=Dissulfurimicrobium hydrothermale TaxID=1750598 RepID=UPI003C718B85